MKSLIMKVIKLADIINLINAIKNRKNNDMLYCFQKTISGKMNVMRC